MFPFCFMRNSVALETSAMTLARRLFLAITAAVGAGSVSLRLSLNLIAKDPAHGLVWRLVDFFSYFTELTNILAAIVAAAAVLRPSSRLARPGVFAATSVYILVVAVTYQLLLRGDPHGLAMAADIGQHLLAPFLFILAWLVFIPKRGLTWTAPVAWLAYPAAFMAWTLVRGAVQHRYPYFFADAEKLGYPHALLNGALFLAVFYGLGLGAVALGRVGRQAERATA